MNKKQKAASQAIEPVFILCPGRSFSSVVCSMLGQHPHLFGLPELNLFLFETIGELLDMSTPPFGLAHLRAGVLRTLAYLHTEQQTEEAVEEARAWLEARRHWSTSELFLYLQDLVAPRRCIDKSPTNVAKPESLARLAETFPSARYLHLARHPRATCRSRQAALSKHKRLGVDASVHEFYWASCHAMILEFSRHIEPWQYIYLKGEDLLENPDPHLLKLAKWLGVSTSKRAIAAMKQPERSPFATPGPANARAGNNSGFMSNPSLRVGKVAAETLEGPLEWRDDGKGFSPHSIALAHRLGYQ